MTDQPAPGSLGVSHTRWATHGKVTDENAHPHFDASGKLALVHNGVIENYQAIKEQLIQDGDTNFRSETDSEVLAHLIGKLYDESCASTVDAPGKKRGSSAPFAPRFNKSSAHTASPWFMRIYRIS
jgi:glucosamine--fructose-6-phosphate aminotransferase (isomerizing)